VILEQELKKLNFSYKLHQFEWNLCLGFARRAVRKSFKLYTQRGAPNESKIILDIAYGKAAEVAAYRILSPFISSLAQPDFMLYPNEQKSYTPDLETAEAWFHVKSTTREEDPSWLFSYKEPFLQNDSGNGENTSKPHFGCLFTIRHKEEIPTCKFRWLVNLNQWNDWKPPYNESQKRTKKVIYEKDILLKCP